MAELRWTEAAHHSANNEVDEVNKWNELADQTLEALSPKESGDVALSGSLSNQLIDEVLIRTAARFGSNRALQKAIVTRMQAWITSVRGDELAALNSVLSEQ